MLYSKINKLRLGVLCVAKIVCVRACVCVWHTCPYECVCVCVFSGGIRVVIAYNYFFAFLKKSTSGHVIKPCLSSVTQ